MSKTTRRKFLEQGAAGAGVVALAGCVVPRSYEAPDAPEDAPGPGHPTQAFVVPDTGAEWGDTAVETPSCHETTEFAEGPYYRADAPARTDLRTAGETGTITYFSGTVRSGGDCSLLADAELELWHVQQDESYDMSTSDMHYRTKVRMGFDGAFAFITLKPISYMVSEVQTMPMHYHFRIVAQGHETLITQLRYVDDPHDDGMAPASLLLSPTVNADGSETVHFDFVLTPS